MIVAGAPVRLAIVERALGGAGIVVFAGEQIKRAALDVDLADAAADVAVDGVEMQVAFEHAGSALHVVPQRFPALGLRRGRRDQPETTPAQTMPPCTSGRLSQARS